ncbi:hypothetical protein [Murimonas intestini]|uniref:hypothetical protein n=1 Tax=Murimonas intestini TaxID=1337051 RepID=UPI00248C65D7|nr:hypothetical protein [Murimonas intestini]
MKIKNCFLTVLASSCILGVCAAGGCSQTAGGGEKPEWMAGKDFSKHLEISVGYWNIEEMAARTQPDAIQKYIEELLNITIKPVSVTWTNYKEYYQMLNATDNLPDVFATLTISSNDSNDSAIFEDFINSGAIRPLPDDLTGYPDLNSLFDDLEYTRRQDGKYYAIPRVSFRDEILGSTDAAMLVRRDWMDNLSIDDPKNLDEFIDMITAFAKDDPDGNGIDDTLGYNVNNLVAIGKWVMLGIAPECNTYTWVESDDGTFVPCWTTEGFKDVVAAYRRMYESGGLDPDFYIKTPNAVMEDFANGRLGALEYKSAAGSLEDLKALWDRYNDKPFDECVDILHIFPAPDGNCYSNSSFVSWSESFISSQVDDEKMERILCLYEYLLSDEGIRLTKYGLEGEDYELDKDGSYSCLLDTDSQSTIRILQEKYPSIYLFANLASLNGGWSDFEETEANYLRYGRHCVTLAKKDVTWNQENTIQLERPYQFLLFPKETSDIFSTTNAFNSFVKCIIGEEDAVLMWEKVLDGYKKQGLNEYIQRKNERYFESKEAESPAATRRSTSACISSR